MTGTTRPTPRRGISRRPLLRRISRRALLRAAAAAPLAGLVAACGDGKSAAAAGPKPSVLIVGGGLCGLRLLDLLVARGHDAKLVEGWSRLGGRVYTVRDGPRRIELGAERVSAGDARVRALMDELGAPPVAYPQPAGPMTVAFKALRTNYDTPAPELFAGTAEKERGFGPLLVHLALVYGAPELDPADPRTAARWLKDLGMTARGEELVRAYSYHDVDALPAATFQRMARLEHVALDSALVAGGTDRLVEGLRARHAARISTGLVVESVAASADRAEIVLRGGEKRAADVVVVATSAAAARRLRFEGGVPPPFAARLDALAMGDELKVSAFLPAAAEKAAGHGARDAFPRATWTNPERDADGGFVFNTMAVREDLPAVRAAVGAGTSGLAAFMAKRLPDVATFQPRWVAHDWKNDPLFGGAYAYAKAAAGLVTGPIRDGRLVLAGADFSAYPGWMEGALESAEDASALLAT